MRKHWFKILLLALVLVLGVAVWGVLDTLWNNMAAYESASEIGAVSEYFNRFAAGDYDTAVETSGFVFDEKNSKEDYVQYLKDTFGSDFSDLRFAGRDADEKGEKLYRVYCGNKPKGFVRLIPVTGQARNWKVVCEVTFAAPLSVTAPSFVAVSANGVVQTPPAEAVSVNKDFSDLKDVYAVPTITEYTLTGYLYTPTVSGVAPDGTVCDVQTAQDGSVVLTVPVEEAKKAEYEGLMTDFAKLYARFISEDATFAALKSKMMTGTEFYESVRTFYNGWYTTHTGYEFRNLEISNLARTDENTFVGNIKFDYVVFRGTKEHVYPSSYRLSFCRSDGKWLLGDLNMQ